MIDQGFGSIGSNQAPLVLVLRAGQCQAGQPGQIGGNVRSAMTFQQFRAGHQALATVGENAQHQVAVFHGWRTHADGDIEPFLDDIYTPIGRIQVQLDLRVAHLVIGQHVGDSCIKQRHRTTDSDRAARLGTQAINGVLGGLGLDEHGLAVVVIDAADLGHADMAGGTIEQACIQALFQRGNPAAEL